MDKKRFKISWDKLQLFAIWVLGSLLAIAVIGDQPYLALAIAILSGIVLGLASLLVYDKAAGPGEDSNPKDGVSPTQDDK